VSLDLAAWAKAKPNERSVKPRRSARIGHIKGFGKCNAGDEGGVSELFSCPNRELTHTHFDPDPLGGL
jgi:hypothetical protein